MVVLSKHLKRLTKLSIVDQNGKRGFGSVKDCDMVKMAVEKVGGCFMEGLSLTHLNIGTSLILIIIAVGCTLLGDESLRCFKRLRCLRVCNGTAISRKFLRGLQVEKGVEVH